MIGTTLHYPYEIREAKEYFEGIPDVEVAPDMLKLAEHIVKSKAGDFNPTQFGDHYEQALIEMLKKKQDGIAVSRRRAAPPPHNVANLMDVLRRSIEQGRPASAPRKKPRKRAPIYGSAGHQQLRMSRSPWRSRHVARRATVVRLAEIGTPVENTGTKRYKPARLVDK